MLVCRRVVRRPPVPIIILCVFQNFENLEMLIHQNFENLEMLNLEMLKIMAPSLAGVRAAHLGGGAQAAGAAPGAGLPEGAREAAAVVEPAPHVPRWGLRCDTEHSGLIAEVPHFKLVKTFDFQLLSIS